MERKRCIKNKTQKYALKFFYFMGHQNPIILYVIGQIISSRRRVRGTLTVKGDCKKLRNRFAVMAILFK
jgi:hypothetical protein